MSLMQSSTKLENPPASCLTRFTISTTVSMRSMEDLMFLIWIVGFRVATKLLLAAELVKLRFFVLTAPNHFLKFMAPVMLGIANSLISFCFVFLCSIRSALPSPA